MTAHAHATPTTRTRDAPNPRGGARTRDALWIAARINILGLGLMALWNTLNTILLPDRVDATAPAALRGSALGLIGFVGVGLAALVQPIIGRISDRASLADRRKPFITWGSVAAVGGLLAFGLAPGFWWLLLAYVALQLAANVAQTAYQALIPDLVPEDGRGLASGVKNTLTVLGAAVGLLGARALLALDAGQWPALAYLALVLLATAALNDVWTPRVGLAADDQRVSSLGELFDPPAVFSEIAATLREHRSFRLAVLGQFIFLFGTYPVQRYLVYFLKERFGEDGALERATLALLAAILLGALAAAGAGAVSDRVGRLPVLRWCVVLATVGLVGIALAPWLIVAGVAGVCIAVGVGAFQAVNWALLSDDIPEGQGARFYGVANIATAGAGALSGVFGLLVDGASAILPGSGFPITYSVAAAVTLASLLALRGVRE
jgi:MFS family permease